LQHPIDTIYSSENGESQWAKELAIAIIRNNDALTSPLNVLKPAQCYGDMGAANGSVLLALAIEKSRQQKANKQIMVYSSSDSGARGALCLTTEMASAASVKNNNRDSV